jgi:hypothetical protein
LVGRLKVWRHLGYVESLQLKVHDEFKELLQSHQSRDAVKSHGDHRLSQVSWESWESWRREESFNSVARHSYRGESQKLEGVRKAGLSVLLE